MGVSTRLTVKEGRKFAFTLAVAFLVLGTISYWRGHYFPPRVLWTVGGVLLAAGAVIPTRLGGVQHRWMRLAVAISKVTAPIFIGVVYFGVVTPMGVVMRAFGRNPLRHKENQGSYWKSAQSGGRSNLENQF